MNETAQLAAEAAPPEDADIVTSSDDYAGRFAGTTGEWFLRVQENIAVRLMDCPPGAGVLDVGGGHGQVARPLCRLGYGVTVLGSSEACRARAAELVEAQRCVFRVGNVIALPFEDRSFELALSFRLLPHCTRWQNLVAELCRVAARQVIVDYPAITGINALAPAFFGAKQQIEGNTRTWRQFKHAEIEDAFEQHGFRLQARQGQFFLPMVLHRTIRCRILSRFMEGTSAALGLRTRFGSPVIAAFARQGESV